MKLFNSIILVFSLFCCVFGDNDENERILSSQLNPECEKQRGDCKDIVFLHIQAESTNDTLHYLWDFTGFPSLLIAKTDKNVTLKVDWDSFMNGSVNSLNFSSSPNFIFSAVIHKILVFDDPNDSADVNDKSVKDVRHFSPHYFTWSMQNYTLDDKSVVLVMNASIGENGTFALKVKLS